MTTGQLFDDRATLTVAMIENERRILGLMLVREGAIEFFKAHPIYCLDKRNCAIFDALCVLYKGGFVEIRELSELLSLQFHDGLVVYLAELTSL